MTSQERPARDPASRYFAAAQIAALPVDLETPRRSPMGQAAAAAAYARISAATRIWCAAEDDDGRRALLATGALPDDARSGLMRHLGSPRNRIDPSEVEHAIHTLGLAEANNGVLSNAEKSALDRDGYVNLGKLLDDATLAALRARFDDAIEAEGAAAGREVSQTPGIGRMSGTVLKPMNRDGLLDPLVFHLRLLAAVRHVLGVHFKYSSSNYHCPLPGYGHQGIHADFGWGTRTPEVVNAIWMLDDFTLENGPTRVVPGSHRWGKHPLADAVDGKLRDPHAPVAGERLITGEAGSCFVYNAHLWHSGTQNCSPNLRRAQHAFFTRSVRQPQMDAAAVIDRAVYAHLSRVQRALLDLPEGLPCS